MDVAKPDVGVAARIDLAERVLAAAEQVLRKMGRRQSPVQVDPRGPEVDRSRPDAALNDLEASLCGKMQMRVGREPPVSGPDWIRACSPDVVVQRKLRPPAAAVDRSGLLVR